MIPDLEISENWPRWLVSLLVPIVRPFAVTDEWVARRPWETIQRAAGEFLTNLSRTELYLGVSYILSGASTVGKGQENLSPLTSASANR